MPEIDPRDLALKLVLLFYGGRWSSEQTQEWNHIVATIRDVTGWQPEYRAYGGFDASTKVLCGAVRAAVAWNEKKERG